MAGAGLIPDTAVHEQIVRRVLAPEQILPLLKLGGVIPISARDSRQNLEDALAAARDQLDQGFIVCIFAEGAISRSGMMLRFRSGFARIAKGTDCPIIPVYIGGAWGSIFDEGDAAVLMDLGGESTAIEFDLEALPPDDPAEEAA